MLFQASEGMAAINTEQLISQSTNRLESLFVQQEKSKTPSYYDNAIAKERIATRKIFDDDMEQLIEQSTALTGSTLTTRSALERQQTLVQTLQEKLREANVDIDLLNQEERNVYSDNPWFGTGSSTRLTQTHAELKAKVAVLQEQSAAIEAVLPTQEERLSKLKNDERYAQFGAIIGVLEYLLIVLLVVAFERFARLRLLPMVISDQVKRYRFSKLFAACVYVLLVVTVIARLSADQPGILTSFAIIGAALAVALQDVVKDMLSWIIILQSRRYSIGDRITVGQWTGDVIDVSPLRTTMLEVATSNGRDIGRTGKTVAIPNMLTLSQAVLNYNTSSDFLRLETEITVTFESDYKHAKKILAEILEEITGKYTEPARQQERMRMQQFYLAEMVGGPSVYMDLAGSGVLFMLRFYAPVGQHRTITSKIAAAILDRFAEEGIGLAYNTSRVYATNLNGDGMPVVIPAPPSKKG